MKIYFATWVAERTQKDALDACKISRRLMSYYYAKRKVTPKGIPLDEYVKTPGLKMMLDSGAYSAWERGLNIDIEAYAKFALAYKAVFPLVVNMDVIPGSWGHVPSQSEIDRSAARGWENYRVLTKLLGHAPMHVYHQGESIKWLKKLMDESDYIGISPGNDRANEEKMRWLDEIMPVLVDHKGRPIRKFHGFGMSAEELMARYPWYSIDATSWVVASRFGLCFVRFDGRSRKIAFSARSTSRTVAGRHFDTFSRAEQQEIRAYLRRWDTSPEALAKDFAARDILNARFFLELEQTLKPKTWQRRTAQTTIF